MESLSFSFLSLRQTSCSLVRRIVAQSQTCTGLAAPRSPHASLGKACDHSHIAPSARPSHALRWHRHFASAADFAARTDKRQIVFLGTPEVAARVLHNLLAAARAPDSTFDIAAVVSQPGRPRGRGSKRVPQPSPVEKLALDSGFPSARILCPNLASDPAFLDALRAMHPDLCITAAYGNYLPSKFLRIPKYGTLNIHPSLLPAYRGAAPVQRSLQDGIRLSGATVLYTVKEMDAGPIVAQQKVPIPDDIQAPELLDQLFDIGTDLLLKNLEGVWAGLTEKAATKQDDASATHAPKLTREEGHLNFESPATVCHNKVRGFAGWPGTFHSFRVDSDAGDDGKATGEEVELKIIRTRVGNNSSGGGGGGGDSMAKDGRYDQKIVEFRGDAMRIVCGDGSVLEVLEVQAPGRKVVAAKDFANGMKGKTLMWQSNDISTP